jgi:hypothetical protein
MLGLGVSNGFPRNDVQVFFGFLCTLLNAMTSIAQTNSAAVEGSGTEVAENVAACGCRGLLIWMDALVPG